MMELKRFDDINKFLQTTKPLLLENEVENNLILGVSLHIKSNPEKYQEKYLAVISQEYYFTELFVKKKHKLHSII